MKLFGFKQNALENLHEMYTRGQSLWKLPSITVYEATQKSSGRTVYLWLYDEKVKKGDEEYQLFSARIRATLALKLPMPRILNFGIDEKGTAFIITEPGGNICLSRISIPPEKIPPTFYAIVKMVNQLHAKGLYLGTISPELFSVDSGGKIYLQAPTFLFHSLAKAQLNEHTESFIAPELKSGTMTTAESDSYSLGALLYFMMNRNYLRMAHNARQHNEYVEKYLPSFLLSRFKSISWTVDLLLDCLKWEPDQRPASAQVIFERMKSHMPVAQKTIQSMVPLFEWKKLGTIFVEIFATRIVAGTLACFGLLFFISAGDLFSNSSASDPLAKTFTTAVTEKEASIPSEKFSLFKRQNLNFGEPVNGFEAVHELEAKRDKSKDFNEDSEENLALARTITMDAESDQKEVDAATGLASVGIAREVAVGPAANQQPEANKLITGETPEFEEEKSATNEPGRFVSTVPYIEEQFTAVESMISYLVRKQFPDAVDRSWCKQLELDPEYTPISKSKKSRQ